MPVEKQLSFTGGEVNSSLWGRADLQKFDSSCRTLLNMIIHAEGGASNRPGSKYVGVVPDSSTAARLIPFKFNTEQTYQLEFSDFAMRVLKDGAYVLEPSVSVTAISTANPCELTIGAHTYVVGQDLYLSGASDSMVELPSGTYRINSVTATTVTIEDIFGNNIDSTLYTAYTAGATVGVVPVFDTFFPHTDLRLLKFTQSADVLTVTHPNHNRMYDFSRTDHHVWTVTPVVFVPGIDAPTGFTATPNTANTGLVRDYVVTATDEETGEESIASSSNNANHDISAGTGRTNDCTWTVVVGASKYSVYCDDTASGVFGYIGSATTNIFEDNYIDPDYTKTPPETKSPLFVFEDFVITGASQTNPCVLTITAGDRTPAEGDQVDISGVTGMVELNGNTYFATSATATSITLEEKDGTPLDALGFGLYTGPSGTANVSEQGYAPRCLTYHQQRRMHGGPTNKPSTWFTSRIGLFTNMNVSAITQDDDAITFNVVAEDVNEIRDMKSQKHLFLFTSSGVWQLSTGEKIAFAAENIASDEIDSWGVSNVRVLKVGQSMLYVQDGGRVVRDLQDTIEANGYSGDELTLLAKHMFKNRTIVEWAFARDPDSIVWCVMDDGTVNALTYLRKHQVWGWTRHNTDGFYESVSAIPEGTGEYGVYFVVRRTVNGQTMRYVERLANRNITSIKDSFFVDSGLSFDNPINVTGATQTDPVVITTDTTDLSNGDLIDMDDFAGMVELNGNRYKVANKTGTTIELTDKDDVDIDGTGFAAYESDGVWRAPVTSVSGLDHLEGKTVSILADGGTETQKVVTNGQVTIDDPASRIHAGLPFVSDLETIGVDLTSLNGFGDALARRKANIIVKLRVDKTVGIWIGPNEDELEEYKPPAVEANEGQQFISDVIAKSFLPVWDHHGTVFVRQADPLPMTILSIMPEVEVVENS